MGITNLPLHVEDLKENGQMFHGNLSNIDHKLILCPHGINRGD
jgi:hypothetical protein